MHKAYKYRLYPNKKQQILLEKTFGCVRFFWNKQVEVFNSYDKKTNPQPVFKTVKQTREEFEWMKEVSFTAVQQKERDFKKFRVEYFSKTRKSKIGKPKFKNKGGKQSFRLANSSFYLKKDKINLYKIGFIKLGKNKPLPENCKLLSATISKDATGKYYASVLVETEIKHLPKTGKVVGIDVGLKEFATLSDGKVIANPKYFRESQAKLKKAQRRLSKKVKGSSRYKKCKLKVARIHKKIANQREHFLHTFSLQIVKDYDHISIEDLNVEGMKKNKKLAKSIFDASFYKFFTMLDYKSKWYGKELTRIPRFAPSSKTCSNCGAVKKELTLSERIYNCEACGFTEDRDLNAAININAIGVEIAQRA